MEGIRLCGPVINNLQSLKSRKKQNLWEKANIATGTKNHEHMIYWRVRVITTYNRTIYTPVT